MIHCNLVYANSRLCSIHQFSLFSNSRKQGFSKAGSFRDSTLEIMGLSVSAVSIEPFKVLLPRSTQIILTVECLKPGQTACKADSKGNIGTGNDGKNNFGDYNIGDNNIGGRWGNGVDWVGGSACAPELLGWYEGFNQIAVRLTLVPH